MLFQVINYYPIALTGVSLLLAACGLLVLRNRSRQGLRTLLAEYRAVRRSWSLGPLVLAVFLLNCFLLPAALRLHTSAEITLHYSLASQGLNPNGTRFNQADILSAQVLEGAIEKGALEGITAQDLKNTIQVRPVVQGNSYSEDAYFISTQFVVQYNASSETASQDGEKLLTLVTQAYKDCYSANPSILRLDFSPAEGADYLDSCLFLAQTAQSIGEYMRSMSGEEPAFRSSASGETFQSVSALAYEVEETLVERLEAYVLEEGISRDPGQYVNRLEVANVFMRFNAQKAAASNENMLEAITMYEDDMARIVLVPTYDTNNQFYMSQTRIGVDDFAANANHYVDEKIAIQEKIAYNDHVIGQLSGRSGGAEDKAEALIGQIRRELTRIAGLAEELVKEYNARQANRYMTAVVSSSEAQAMKLAAEIAARTVLFAAGLRLCWFSLAGGRKRR